MSNFTPAWFKKGFFNESLFCDDFLSIHQLLYSNGAFFTPDGRMVDPMPLRCEIFEMMREYRNDSRSGIYHRQLAHEERHRAKNDTEYDKYHRHDKSPSACSPSRKEEEEQTMKKFKAYIEYVMNFYANYYRFYR